MGPARECPGDQRYLARRRRPAADDRPEARGRSGATGRPGTRAGGGSRSAPSGQARTGGRPYSGRQQDEGIRRGPGTGAPGARRPAGDTRPEWRDDSRARPAGDGARPTGDRGRPVGDRGRPTGDRGRPAGDSAVRLATVPGQRGTATVRVRAEPRVRDDRAVMEARPVRAETVAVGRTTAGARRVTVTARVTAGARQATGTPRVTAGAAQAAAARPAAAGPGVTAGARRDRPPAAGRPNAGPGRGALVARRRFRTM